MFKNLNLDIFIFLTSRRFIKDWILFNQMAGREVRQIRISSDFLDCEIGDIVEKHGRTGVYAGREYHPTCSCPCGGRLITVPVIIYKKDDGTIEREEVLTSGPTAPKKITNLSFLYPIAESDDKFERYQQLLSAIRNLN